MRAANRSHPSLIPAECSTPFENYLLILIKRGQTITPGRGEAVERARICSRAACYAAAQNGPRDSPGDIRRFALLMTRRSPVEVIYRPYLKRRITKRPFR